MDTESSWGNANFTLHLPNPWGPPQKRSPPISNVFHLQHMRPALSGSGGPLLGPAATGQPCAPAPSPCGPSVPSEGLRWAWPHPGLLQHLLLLTPELLLTLLGITVPISLLFNSLQASSIQVRLPYAIRRHVSDSPKTFPPALYHSQLSTGWACSFWSSALTHQGENTDAANSCD